MLILGPGHCRPPALAARGRRSLQASFELEPIIFKIIEVWAIPGCYSRREHQGRRYVAALWNTNRRPMELIETLRLALQEMPSLAPSCIPGSLTAFRLLGE